MLSVHSIGWIRGEWQVLFTSEKAEEIKMASCSTLVAEEQILLITKADYLTCVVYNKTIIHLSVGKSGGYLPPLR